LEIRRIIIFSFDDEKDEAVADDRSFSDNANRRIRRIVVSGDNLLMRS
jgi:hypothetical protein